MARLLLDHGAYGNIARNDLWSPSHLASANGHLKLLVERGASVGVINDKNETPLYLAVTNGNAAVARLLIDHGATGHTANSIGRAFLNGVARNWHLAVIKLLLLGQGTDVVVLNKPGKSASRVGI